MKTLLILLTLAFASSTAQAACKTNFLFGVCKTVKDKNNGQNADKARSAPAPKSESTGGTKD